MEESVLGPVYMLPASGLARLATSSHTKKSIRIFVSLYMRKRASPVSEISLKHW